MMSERLETLPLEAIRLDGGTQIRGQIDPAVVAEYAEAMQSSEVFAPIGVCFDGAAYWLWDGFHRYHAAKIAGLESIPATISEGTQRDALLRAAGANARHGLRRSNEDKRRAVLTLLNDTEWAGWSDREIARQTGVSAPFVGRLRDGLSVNGLQIATQRTVERGGTTYTMYTARIGVERRLHPVGETQEVPIDEIHVGRRVREDLGDLVGLAESIKRVGLIHPIVIDANGKLAAGLRRLVACRDLLGWSTILAKNLGELTEDEICEIELTENSWRRACAPTSHRASST